MISLIVFFGMGIAGWLICEKLKIPAPAILGPLFVLGITGFFEIPIIPPSQLRPLLSVVLGIILGLRFNVKLGMVREILLTAVWLVSLTSLAVMALNALGLDKATAIFAAAPGGITEIALAAMSFGVNTFTVAILQLSRMLLTLILIPFLARLNDRKETKIETIPVIPEQHTPAAFSAVLHWIILIGLGFFSAWVFSLLRVPASTMAGPMLTVGGYTWIRKRSVRVNKNLQKLVQVGVGGLVGLSISRESILSLPSYILPIVCLNVILVGGCFILALVLNKTAGWDMLTCLIATAPGGLSPMILLAVEMGADSNRVVVFQVLRMVLVLLLTPFFGGLFAAGV
jgi:membrane AbrB-like protein